MADAAPPPMPASKPSLTQVLATVGVMLLVGAILFFVGLLQGKKPLPELEQRTQAAEAVLAQAQDEARLWQALALIYRASSDLDARNFGTANEHLHAAARALDGLHATDGPGVDELRRLMAETDLTVAENLEAQRARVLSYARELDAHIGEATSDPAPMAPAPTAPADTGR